VIYNLKWRFSDFSKEWINWKRMSENRLAIKIEQL
jgi:hypothetical protein